MLAEEVFNTLPSLDQQSYLCRPQPPASSRSVNDGAGPQGPPRRDQPARYRTRQLAASRQPARGGPGAIGYSQTPGIERSRQARHQRIQTPRQLHHPYQGVHHLTVCQIPNRSPQQLAQQDQRLLDPVCAVTAIATFTGIETAKLHTRTLANICSISKPLFLESLNSAMGLPTGRFREGKSRPRRPRASGQPGVWTLLERATILATVSQVRVVTFLPNVFSMRRMNAGSPGWGR